MIKRPLLWLLGAYVLGSLLYRLSFYLLVVLAMLSLGVTLFYWFRKVNKRHDRFLFMVPFVFLLGAILMWNQQLPGPVDEALLNGPLYTTCEGTISNILEKDNSYELLISDLTYYNSLLKENTNPHYHTNSRIYVYVKEIPQLAIGNRISVAGKLSLFTRPTNPGQFDERFYNKLQNIDYRMMAMEVKVIEGSVDAIGQSFYLLRNKMKSVYDNMGEDTASVLNAMLLGDTKNLKPEIKELYQAAGISHVISISGMHITLLGMALFGLVMKLASRKWATVAAVVFILFYGILTGFSVATNRAVVMMIIFLGAGVFGRTYDLLSAVALSALLILLQEPMQMYNTGFLLSYGAILGIGISYPCLMKLLSLEERKKREEAKLLSLTRKQAALHKRLNSLKLRLTQLLLFQCAIQIILLPLLLMSFYRIPTYSFLMNLMVVPVMDYVILFGLPAGFLGCFVLSISRFFLASTHYIITFSNMLCSLVYHLPAYYLVIGKPDLMELMAYAILAILGLCLANKGKKLSIVLFLCGTVILLIPFPKKSSATITALDVGQGDCFVIESPKGSVYMIDGGSSDVSQVGKYRILPFLYSNGIDHIEYLFLTHCDEDHTSGVLEVMEASKMGECTIENLVLADTSYEDEAYKEMLVKAKECSIPVLKMKRGDSLMEGELSMTCLHPTYEYSSESANDASLVLSFTYGEFDMLFTGDVGIEGESAILQEIDIRQYEVLKVAHHGSKNSSSEAFLQAISPKFGIISCGKNNSYGHPHMELLERLEKIGCKTYLTMEGGAIEIQTDGKVVEMEEFDP